jgi:hypothetical protein
MYLVRTAGTGTYWYVTQKVRTFSLKYVLLSCFLYSVRTIVVLVPSTYLFEKYVLSTYLG